MSELFSWRFAVKGQISHWWCNTRCLCQSEKGIFVHFGGFFLLLLLILVFTILILTVSMVQNVQSCTNNSNESLTMKRYFRELWTYITLYFREKFQYEAREGWQKYHVYLFSCTLIIWTQISSFSISSLPNTFQPHREIKNCKWWDQHEIEINQNTETSDCFTMLTFRSLKPAHSETEEMNQHWQAIIDYYYHKTFVHQMWFLRLKDKHHPYMWHLHLFNNSPS